VDVDAAPWRQRRGERAAVLGGELFDPDQTSLGRGPEHLDGVEFGSTSQYSRTPTCSNSWRLICASRFRMLFDITSTTRAGALWMFFSVMMPA
jgi:hypothetical protein